jgi:hypothetical protein
MADFAKKHFNFCHIWGKISTHTCSITVLSLDCADFIFLFIDCGAHTDDGYCKYGNSSGRGKGDQVICFENITSELW